MVVGSLWNPKHQHTNKESDMEYKVLNNDLQEIRLLDTGRNVTGWPSDALKYNPEIGSSNY